MAKFAKGDQIRNESSGLDGVIVDVLPATRGRQTYMVMYSDGSVKSDLEKNLTPKINLEDAFERCKNRIYGNQSEYCLANTTFKIFDSSNNTLSSLKASKTIFRAYQFKPLLKFLNSDNRKILVADEVGLGKTIEAGHILLEMKARGQLRNALIICPKSLQVKWREELLNKFGLSFKIYEKPGELVEDLRERGLNLKGIINYEKIRSKIVRIPKVVNGKKDEERFEKNPILQYLMEGERGFDFVICDEAHRLRNRETKSYKGAEILFERARALVMLTATPIMIDEENLFNLLALLQPDRFPNYQTFKTALDYNRPFIHALASLSSRVPVAEIIQTLRGEKIESGYTINEEYIRQADRTVDEIFGDTPLYKKIIKDCEEREDDLQLRAELQYNLSRMSPINTLFSRTRKVDVTTDWSQPKREPHKRVVQLFPEEQALFDEVIEDYIEQNSYVTDYGDESMLPGASLGLVQRKRMVASSVYGMKNEQWDLDEGIDAYKDYPDAKVIELISIIRTVQKEGNGKLIVFAIFKNTLKYLKIRLAAAGIQCAIIHGDIQERETVIEDFRSNPKISVLLSSEVGSEGLDMQFCNTIVNYDLPWNPMVVEQRIGRVDRFGQESEVVNIYNIVVKGSIQEQIYIRLLDRIGIFKESIGDLEAILDKEIEIEGKKMNLSTLFQVTEKQFYTTRLTEEQRAQKVAQINQAFENEKLNLKHVEEELSNTLTNDSYFKSEIERIVNDYAYVSEEEIRNTIEKLIEKRLPTCMLKKIEENVYEFSVPECSPKLLSSFLEEFMPPETNEDGRLLFNQYKYKLRDVTSFRLTFNQQYAFEHKTIEFLNIYNPLVMAAAAYFRKQSDKNCSTYCIQLSKDDAEYKAGRYYLAVYQITLKKTVYGNLISTESLVPILYDIDAEVIVDSSLLASKIQGQAQIKGQYLPVSEVEVSPDQIEVLRGELLEEIDRVSAERNEDEYIRVETDKQLQTQRTKELYETRISRLKDSVEDRQRYLTYWALDEKERREAEGAIRLLESNIKTLEIEMDSELSKIAQMGVKSVSSDLFSLTYIQIS